jgi:hypothetical protein
MARATCPLSVGKHLCPPYRFGNSGPNIELAEWFGANRRKPIAPEQDKNNATIRRSSDGADSGERRKITWAVPTGEPTNDGPMAQQQHRREHDTGHRKSDN